MRFSLLTTLLTITSLPHSMQQDEEIPHNEVKNWALKFGVDLWAFGKVFTKMDEIQNKYQNHDARVVKKDGLLLIRDMASEVKNMMDIKMNSIMRIMDSAEQAALSHRLDSDTNNNPIKYVNSGSLRGQNGINLEINRHFDQRPVNTTHSSVIVPNIVVDSDAQVGNALRWSEHLDPVFVNNYEVDPALSWQYFGSTTGFLRRFPAMPWPLEESTKTKDLHDFRMTDWYVGASTSPKDIVIMVETSFSMDNSALELAKVVVKSLLSTLGDNDFVNVFTFSDVTKELIPCFKDLLVQANELNKREIIHGLDNIQIEQAANFSAALVTGFEILHRYNRTSQGCQCNQALMLITTGPKGDYRHLFKEYNWPHMPVRVFTYLVGKDKSGATELYWIACSNKGYYEYVDKAENVDEKVLNYLRVLSRPMVMYQNDHPIHWTPVYAGGQTDALSVEDVQFGKLMTTVSTPVFDRRNTTVRTANLLGVVGTDIPIQEIKKLVPSYKLGVNGYAFIVNNNGQILFHPDLRPLYNKNQYIETLKPIYNSVDLTSVELLDSDLNPREINNSLLNDLRNDMINQKEGETELKVKMHYDNMKRVTTRRNKYFYHPIDGTPFSLGLALPDGYGLYELQAQEEIKLSNANVIEYFEGENWIVHPEWVYCEYNYANEHKFSSAEEQVLHFLSRIKGPGWKWMSLRPRSPLRPHETGQGSTRKMERESHYCDKNLVQSLVFDAMVTQELETAGPSNLKEDKHPIATLMALLRRQGYQMFGITLTFIATRSGLLRWRQHTNNAPNDRSFARGNRLVTDEVWYKRAVEQHTIEPESFVFSVPFDAGSSSKTMVTATHAIFLEYKGNKAPVAVVGLQFQHSILAEHFINATSGCTGNGCKKTCASEDLDCYILDNNGFIIISEKAEQTGMFFGQADGTIMDSLVQDGIYKKVPVIDNQGVCSDTKSHYSDASRTHSMPWETVRRLVHWLFAKMLWLCAQTHIYSVLQFDMAWAQEDIDGSIIYSDYETISVDYDGEAVENDGAVGGSGLQVGNGGHHGADTNTDNGLIIISEKAEQTGMFFCQADGTIMDISVQGGIYKKVPVIDNQGVSKGETTSKIEHVAGAAPTIVHHRSVNEYSSVNNRSSDPRLCTKKVDLYMLQPARLNNSGLFNPLKGKLTNCHVTGCERPFSVQKIPHSNLILLVVDTLCPCGSKQLSITAQEVIADDKGVDCRPPQLGYYRRRPPKCINYHPEETEIIQCGQGISLHKITNSWLFIILYLLFT